MEKPKIGLFIDTFFPMVDGVIMVVDNYARRLMNDFDVTVFAPVGRKNFNDSTLPYKVVRCESKFPLFFLDYDLPMPNQDRKFKKALKESNLDIVHIHSPFSIGKAGLKYAKKHNIPSICHLHSQFKRDFYRATKSKIITKMMMSSIMKTFNKCDLAIAVNEYTRDLFRNEYKLKIPTHIIYNATDMQPVDDKQLSINEVNKKFNLDQNEKIFLFVGRVNKLKNLDFVFSSLAILKEKFDNFKFLIVGSGGDLEHFKNKTEKLKLNKHVLFVGKVMDRELLKALYTRADLFLFPSTYDTDGLVKFEAAAQNTPTVFIENTGASSSIIDGETGFIAKADPEDFADKIFKAMTDDVLYKYVSENISKNLYRTWEDSTKELCDLILKTINEKRGE